MHIVFIASVMFHLGSEAMTLVLIVPVPGHCLSPSCFAFLILLHDVVVSLFVMES